MPGVVGNGWWGRENGYWGRESGCWGRESGMGKEEEEQACWRWVEALGIEGQGQQSCSFLLQRRGRQRGERMRQG
jgi:hypothetical protein